MISLPAKGSARCKKMRVEVCGMLRFQLRSCRYLLLIFAIAMLVGGCPKRNQDFAEGVRAEEMQDYDLNPAYSQFSEWNNKAI